MLEFLAGWLIWLFDLEPTYDWDGPPDDMWMYDED